MGRPLFLSITAVFALATGCTSESADPACWAATSCGAGETCSTADHCASGACSSGVCEPTCSAHADCAAGSACVQVFSTGGFYRRHCSASCGTDAQLIYSTEPVVCEGNLIRACTDATSPGEHCDVCGCPAGSNCWGAEFGCGSGGFCECRVAMPVGSPCAVDEDCTSTNCSGGNDANPSFCQLAAGERCDPTESMQCAYCEEHEPGTFLCSQSCQGDLACPGGYCVGSRTTDRFRCLANCEGTGACGPGFRCDFLETLDFGAGGFACVPVR
jgi:hypothetical protein